jgi:hypothetical protein
VVFRCRFALSERAFDKDIDDDSVLRMHADETTFFSGGAHGFEDRRVIDEKNSRVCHEELEARDTLID